MNHILFIDNIEIECLFEGLIITSSMQHATTLKLKITTHQHINSYGPAFLFCYQGDKMESYALIYEFYIDEAIYVTNTYIIEGHQIGMEYPSAFLLKYHDLLLDLNFHPSYTLTKYIQLCKSEIIQPLENSDLIL